MEPSARPEDTSPEIWALQRQRWRSMTVQQRLARACSLSDDLVTLAIAGIRRTRPELSEEAVYRELLRRRSGAGADDAAFGPEADRDR